MAPAGDCRNCPKRATRPRGLCWVCHGDLSIRGRFPVCKKFGRRGSAEGDGRIPSRPTDWPVGSVERMRVYEERATLGERLQHPDDSTERVDKAEDEIGRYVEEFTEAE